MKTIPIAFAFDENLIFPAKICISSLLMNAHRDTFYDIFILCAPECRIDKKDFIRLEEMYPCKIQFRSFNRNIGKKFEIRSITTACYYRLFIPEVITEYDKIIYSDVDVIFRSDLSDIYENTDMTHAYFAGVNSCAHLQKVTERYYSRKLNLDPRSIIYSGNLIIHSKKIREDNLTDIFLKEINKKYTFQDMDIINLVCKGKIKFLSPAFCYTNYISQYSVSRLKDLRNVFTKNELACATIEGIVHYNGVKPWNAYCVNFDIWWEYYRKSIFFDAKFYFDFFYSKLNEYDHLSLWKRIKILIRFFTVLKNK